MWASQEPESAQEPWKSLFQSLSIWGCWGLHFLPLHFDFFKFSLYPGATHLSIKALLFPSTCFHTQIEGLYFPIPNSGEKNQVSTHSKPGSQSQQDRSSQTNLASRAHLCGWALLRESPFRVRCSKDI